MISAFRHALATLVCALCLCPSALCAQVEGAVWWGYWNTSMPLQPTASAGKSGATCAVRLTAANAQLVDGRIHGLRFWLADKSVVTRAYVWVSRKTFTGDSPDVAMKEVALADLADGGEPTVVLFDEPVDVLPATNRYASVYAGYTIETSTRCGLMAAGAQTRVAANSCLVDWESKEGSNGPLALELLMTGANIPALGVDLQPLPETITMAGGQAVLSCRLTNGGSTPVSGVDCRVTAGGETLAAEHFSFDPPLDELGLALERQLTVGVPPQARHYDCRVEVVAVNGGANPSALAAQPLALIALSQRPVKRTVMEELTGTWCPNCPRGLVGMELLERQFADRFVGIAIHGGDSDEPMRVAAYDGSAFVRSVAASMGGRPSCSFDRVANGDPYWGIGYGPHFGADAVVDYLLGEPCVADVDVSAAWNGQQPDVIDCDVATTFRYAYDGEAHPYALIVVLTADSLSGEGSDWLQVNTLAGRDDLDDDLDFFTQGERYMRLNYNHVAIDVKGVENGIAGSITAPFADGEAQHYLTAFDTGGNTLVQHRDRLHVVAMLVDTRSGSVVNVAQCHVDGGATQGVCEVTMEKTANPRLPAYDLGGRRTGGGSQRPGIRLTGDGKKRMVIARPAASPSSPASARGR